MPLRKWKEGYDWASGVYLVDETNTILDELAQCASFGIAYAAYKKAIELRTWSIIQLREKGRIVWTAKTGGHDPETGKPEVLWERG